MLHWVPVTKPDFAMEIYIPNSLKVNCWVFFFSTQQVGVYHKSSESQTEQWREGGGGQVPSGSDQVCGENDEGEERRGTAHFTGSEYIHIQGLLVLWLFYRQ